MDGNIITQLTETLPITRSQAMDLTNQFLKAVKMEALMMKFLDVEKVAEKLDLYPNQVSEAIDILITPLRKAIFGNSAD